MHKSFFKKKSYNKRENPNNNLWSTLKINFLEAT